MENTTSTIFTDIYLQDDREALERNYIGTNAHELAHQWFGDYITAWVEGIISSMRASLPIMRNIFGVKHLER